MSAHATNAPVSARYPYINPDINPARKFDPQHPPTLNRTQTEPILPSQLPNPGKVTLSQRIHKAIKPDLALSNVAELTPERLRALGDVRGVIFDLDDTLKPLRASVLSPDVAQMLHTLQDEGFQIGIVSNNPSKAHCAEAQQLLKKEGLHIPFIGQARKPTASDFRTMINHFKLAPEQVAMVGDSPICDIIGSKQVGLKSVKAKWFLTTRPKKALALTGDVFNTLVNTMRRKRKTENQIQGILDQVELALPSTSEGNSTERLDRWG